MRALELGARNFASNMKERMKETSQKMSSVTRPPPLSGIVSKPVEMQMAGWMLLAMGPVSSTIPEMWRDLAEVQALERLSAQSLL